MSSINNHGFKPGSTVEVFMREGAGAPLINWTVAFSNPEGICVTNGGSTVFLPWTSVSRVSGTKPAYQADDYASMWTGLAEYEAARKDGAL